MVLAILRSLNHLTGFFAEQLKQTFPLPHLPFPESSSRYKFDIILDNNIFNIY